MNKLFMIILLSMFLSFCGSKTEDTGKPIHGEWDFQLKKIWETNQIGSHPVDKIHTIGVNKDGKIFLWEGKQLKVLVCNADGTFLSEFGRRGEGPGEFMDPWATRMFLREDKVILHESNKARIHIYAQDNSFIETKKLIKRKYSHALKTFLTPYRFLFFLANKDEDKDKSLLGIYDLSTGKIEEIATLPGDKPLYAEDKGAGNISLVLPDVAPTTVITQLDGKKIFYGRNNEYVIKRLDLDTKKTFTISLTGREGNKISDASLKKRFEVSYIQKPLQKKLMEQCPKRTNFFNRILVRENGLIYVFVPDWEKKNTYEIDIFSPEGKYLYHSILKMPAEYSRVRRLTFSGNHIYFVADDKEGESKLVKYQITSPAGV